MEFKRKDFLGLNTPRIRRAQGRCQTEIFLLDLDKIAHGFLRVALEFFWQKKGGGMSKMEESFGFPRAAH